MRRGRKRGTPKPSGAGAGDAGRLRVHLDRRGINADRNYCGAELEQSEGGGSGSAASGRRHHFHLYAMVMGQADYGR